KLSGALCSRKLSRISSDSHTSRLRSIPKDNCRKFCKRSPRKARSTKSSLKQGLSIKSCLLPRSSGTESSLVLERVPAKNKLKQPQRLPRLRRSSGSQIRRNRNRKRSLSSRFSRKPKPGRPWRNGHREKRLKMWNSPTSAFWKLNRH